MRSTLRSVLAITSISLVSTFAVLAQDVSRSIADGGISVPGWAGKADTNPQGQTVKDAKFAKEGDAIHFVTGPAVTYWNPANKASGDYTVKATFKEPKFQNLNTHPHPYGIMIAGNDLDTDHDCAIQIDEFTNELAGDLRPDADGCPARSRAVHPTEPRFIGKHDAQATATPGGSPPRFPHSIGKIVFLKAF